MPGRNLEDFFLGVLHKKVLNVCLLAEGLKGSLRIPSGYTDGNRAENMERQKESHKKGVQCSDEKSPYDGLIRHEKSHAFHNGSDSSVRYEAGPGLPGRTDPVTV